MRRIAAFTTTLLLLLLYYTKPVMAAESLPEENYYGDSSNILGEYIMDGYLADGTDYTDQSPNMDYTLNNVTKDNVSIKSDQISTDYSEYFSDYYNNYSDESNRLPTYTFSFSDPKNFSLLQDSSMSGPSFSVTKTASDGTTIRGQMTVEPLYQHVNAQFTPSEGYSINLQVTIDASYRYTVAYDVWNEVQQINATETEAGTLQLSLQEYVPYKSLNTPDNSYIDSTTAVQLEAHEGDMIFYPQFSSSIDDYITLSGEDAFIDATLVLMPLVVRDGSFAMVGMLDDTTTVPNDSDQSTMAYDEALSTENDAHPLSPMVVVLMSAGAAVILSAGASGIAQGMSGAASSGSIEVEKNSSGADEPAVTDVSDSTVDQNNSYGITDRIQNWLQSRGNNYELIINEGIDLPEIVCEKGKVLEIPVRIDGAEDMNWLFLSTCICGRENKKPLKSAVVPIGADRGLITISFDGSEVAKKETIYCTVIAINPSSSSSAEMELCEFDLLPDTNPSNTDKYI